MAEPEPGAAAAMEHGEPLRQLAHTVQYAAGDEEIVVEIAMPGRRNAKGVELDASATELSLDDAGCEPLRVRLPTSVDVARIGAKFDKKSSTLRVTLATMSGPAAAPDSAMQRTLSNATDGAAAAAPDEACFEGYDLDCYPYSFSPLLLFAEHGYFDKGYSNYAAVARFFAPQLAGEVDMLANVLYTSGNMRYDDLLAHVTSNCMTVNCCIEAHFTSFHVLPDRQLLFFDPLQSSLLYCKGDDFDTVVGFHLIKCNYGDDNHITENKDYYTGGDSTRIRQKLWRLFDERNDLELRSLRVSWKRVSLDLDKWLLVNGSRDHGAMSTQLTSCTCYFQTYLFAVLCKVGAPSLGRGGKVKLQNVEKLEHATVTIARFLLEFFVVEEGDAGKVMRPLTNSAFVIDFFRHRDAPYFQQMNSYLQYLKLGVPAYELQYAQVMKYFQAQKTLHKFGRFNVEGEMPSHSNTKTLQMFCDVGERGENALYALASFNYYKFRAGNMMFGFCSHIMMHLTSFCEFNALRKNQLLRFHAQLQPMLSAAACIKAAPTTKYRDYYFMPQFEVGQQELVDCHHYTYLLELSSMISGGIDLVKRVNQFLVDQLNEPLSDRFFSTQKQRNYEKMISPDEFRSSRKSYEPFLQAFMSASYFDEYIPLGMTSINLRERREDVCATSVTALYEQSLAQSLTWRMEHEFEREAINGMARMTLRRFSGRFMRQQIDQSYKVSIPIGQGFTYSKYNTLMHFVNVVQCYWHNPDLNNIAVFGKDIRALLVLSCQKVFFEEGHAGGFYHYGPLIWPASRGADSLDLAVAQSIGGCPATVSCSKTGHNDLVLTERVYEYNYLRGILARFFESAKGERLKTDNAVVNLSLLSLMLDFGLYEEHVALLNLPLLQEMMHLHNTRQLQVTVANMIHEFDRKNRSDTVTRMKLEELIFETSCKFMVNKDFPQRSDQNILIQQLTADPAYQQHLLLCKVNMSLCQINKSVEVDYYKVRCNGAFRTVIPENYSKATGEYLEQVTRQYTFSERDGLILYGDLPLFDLSPTQPEMHLFTVRFDSPPPMESMVTYIEFKNTFRDVASGQRYVMFVADNALEVTVSDGLQVCINNIVIEMATVYFNEAISFVPCFSYADSADVILFASKNIHYKVDNGGQFCADYYGMKHELMENIVSLEVFVDLNDDHVFKDFKLSDLCTESKTVLHAPDFLLQVPSRQQLINLLDFAIYVRNLSFFVFLLFLLRRCSVQLDYIWEEGTGANKTTKIAGPWVNAILYVNGNRPDKHYDEIFSKQFFDLEQHNRLPLREFIGVLCENFTKYQPQGDDGQYQIVPTDKQKAFLEHIVTAEECFHFSEVGSGKTKVILPLLCQMFLSNNADAHKHLARGGKPKTALVILVPEHLVPDAKAQVFRYCLNLNFRDEYRVYDDIFALLHDDVDLDPAPRRRYTHYSSRSRSPPKPDVTKQIFVTSFNLFKKALTYDKICKKVRPYREQILVVADEVDDFMDRDKLVFNICSNKANDLDRPTLELYFQTSRAAYRGEPCPDESVAASANPPYWQQLWEKFGAIHAEIQDASRSVNKSFGIFNEATLRHCSTNIAHDIEGYKSLIARPYESVNRAMPGSYYSDVERTIYLTYVVLMEDTAKYDELFQEERKFISFEYWSEHLSLLDFDDLVYGHERLSDLVTTFPTAKEGLTRFLYSIILRRMEIRDKSRSVNSIDVVFNFACIGFTGTPFIDNYPTFAYIRDQREDEIPGMIDRSFYAYTCEELPTAEFEGRFAAFQGQNDNVMVEYVASEGVVQSTDEMATLEAIFAREDRAASAAAAAGQPAAAFNALVDLCGIFKRSSIHDVRDLVLRHFGPDRFAFIYHIDQADSSDRVLFMDSDTDVQYDEEFYKHLCQLYGADLREKVFFFVDNRNVIGKDVPFQLVYQRRFSQPMFTKSAVLAHDVDDFSKIWQAMGRSRTMNQTCFSIYKSAIPAEMLPAEGVGVQDIRTQALTRQLYVSNCDRRMMGNLSSIYQTLIALLNLAKKSFYFEDDIVNSFLEKMQMTIAGKVRRHEEDLATYVLGVTVPARILQHIVTDKFQRSTNRELAAHTLTPEVLDTLLRHIVQQKFEQREPTDDLYDECIRLLSGEQESLMEISYTKEQQKQKQKQQNKSQDSDTMDIFDRRHQMTLKVKTDDYFKYSLTPQSDMPRVALNLPVSVPILSLTYALGGSKHRINVYPTLQFLYSHHIQPEYITKEVRDLVEGSWERGTDPADFCASFLKSAVEQVHAPHGEEDEDPLAMGKLVMVQGLSTLKGEALNGRCGRVVPTNSPGRLGVRFPDEDRPIAVKPENLAAAGEGDAVQQLDIRVVTQHIRQNPLYTIAGLERGVYIIGMKDQLNIHDLASHGYHEQVQYIADEMGFVLFDRGVGGAKPEPEPESEPESDGAAGGLSVDSFGPYFVEQYMLMEVLSKSEVAGNMLDYYVNHKERLQQCLQRYDEKQGKGFICWRFLMSMSKQEQQSALSPRRSPGRPGTPADREPTSLALDSG